MSVSNVLRYYKFLEQNDLNISVAQIYHSILNMGIAMVAAQGTTPHLRTCYGGSNELESGLNYYIYREGMLQGRI